MDLVAGWKLSVDVAKSLVKREGVAQADDWQLVQTLLVQKVKFAG